MPDEAIIKNPGASNPATHQTIDWGRTTYNDALSRQRAWVEKRRKGEVTDSLIFTEHEPVFTLGVRKSSRNHLYWKDSDLKKRGITVSESNRGGDITYHGPGQIVAYPIIDLSESRDLHRYLRNLEQVVINTLGNLGLAANRREGKTGVWLEKRKIGSIGVAVQRWITYHGFALNVSNDLTPFEGIMPCGISDGSVTSVLEELGFAVDPGEVKTILKVEFWKKFLKS